MYKPNCHPHTRIDEKANLTKVDEKRQLDVANDDPPRQGHKHSSQRNPASEMPTMPSDSAETWDTDFDDPRLLAAIEHDTITRRTIVADKFEKLSRHLQLLLTLANDLRTLVDEQG